MFSKFFGKRARHTQLLFTTQYIDAKGLFLYHFDRVPSISYITGLDMSKAYPVLRERLSGATADILQHAQYNRDAGCLQFNVTFLVLTGNRLVEAGSDYVVLLHTGDDHHWAEQVLRQLAPFTAGTDKPNRIGFATAQMAN